MDKFKVTIIGVGLIGGSLGLALRRAGGERLVITGVDSCAASLAEAVKCGAIDSGTVDLAAGAAGADVVILCTPVLQIPAIVAQISPHLKAGAIVTDVGSTKHYLAEKLKGLIPAGVHYVGGHPMAGREKSGITAADQDLFRDKWYIITPEADTPAEAVETVRGLVSLTGAKVTVMDVARHDTCAAVISHVPHVAAAALVNLLGCYPGQEENMLSLAGGGFCDITRIASSNADMWADICLTNDEKIVDGLVHFQGIVDGVIAAIRRGDRAALHAFFREAKTRRDGIISSL